MPALRYGLHLTSNPCPLTIRSDTGVKWGLLEALVEGAASFQRIFQKVEAVRQKDLNAADEQVPGAYTAKIILFQWAICLLSFTKTR